MVNKMKGIEFNNISDITRPSGFSNKNVNKVNNLGWKNFTKNGLPPNPKTSELWKYTNFHNLTKTNFFLPQKESLDLKTNPEVFSSKKFQTIYIVDGFYNSEKSFHSDNITVEKSNELSALETLSEKFGEIASNDENEMIALNSAFMLDPIFISIDDSKKENNLNIVFVTTNNKNNISSFPRLFVQVNSKSQTNILESYFNLSSDKKNNLVVPVIEYLLEKGSNVSHKRMQIDSGNSFFFQFDRVLQKEESKFISTSFSLSGLVSRYDIHSDLVGINSECNFHGLYITNKNQLQENEISITHSVEKCSSDQMFKGILAGKSKAVFSGKVLVKQDAQKTRAFQKDLNFLLSKDCEVDTKPSLEIYADDVECSHGATAGNMDKNMLFYLQSRGINNEDAMSMLIRGFAQEIIDEFEDDEIIEYLENSIDNSIPSLDIQGIL
ncbi:MAG: Fe-S cluster assembly protein SufD [Chloroflexi bacterium]|nr:Fe-S cluster assembly protein SufD [Chloroflexota bacterium]